MVSKLFFNIFTITILLFSFIIPAQAADCPLIPADNGTLEIPTGAQCTYSAVDLLKNNITIEGNGDIILTGDVSIRKNITIASPTVNITFEGAVTVETDGAITNNGIVTLQGDYKQTGGSFNNTTRGVIAGKNISFEITDGTFNHSGEVRIDNEAQPSKTVAIKGSFGNDVNLNPNSTFSVKGSDVTFSTTESPSIIAGEVHVFDANLYLNPNQNNEKWEVSETGKLVVLDTQLPYDKGFIYFATDTNKATIDIKGEVYTTGFKGSSQGGQSTLILCNGSGKLYLTAGNSDVNDKAKFSVTCSENIVSVDVVGCGDPVATNYNPAATSIENSLCEYIVGCMDAIAENFNPAATQPNNSLCEYIYGCTDPTAENYNTSASKNDGSCTYANTDVYGCMDTGAYNYNSSATHDNGYCIYNGCMDYEADNYNPQASIQTDDVQCEYSGCMDKSATNYNPQATIGDISACTYSCNCAHVTTYDCMIACSAEEDGDDILLPVTLTEFSAKIVKSTVQLNWKTASETKNDFFTLWRSHNGVQFSEIATIGGNGTTSQTQQYDFTDKNPHPGISYYRLSQTDFDGSTTFHRTVPVYYTITPASFNIVSYSFGGITTLQCNFSDAQYAANVVKIYSITGRLHYEKNIPAGMAQYTIEVPLQAGVYIVTNTHRKTTSSMKIVVQ